MNVFYEEEGAFKVGTVLADNKTSLQVEAPHGKRSKVKAGVVLLRFEQPPPSAFLEQAQALADGIDVDFLWQCCGDGEFAHDDLALEYFGHPPGPVESAAVLFRLHGAPMYFYKKGRGRYKPAPEEALKAALASLERKRQQAAQKEHYVEQLTAGRLPSEFEPMLASLLYRPDKNSIEWKALEEASAAQRIAPARLLERCGALPSSHDFHLNRFLYENFPRGAGFGPVPQMAVPSGLPGAGVEAFSIDDASTTEIDDAFSVMPLADGHWRIGIHIAAPAFGIESSHEVDRLARERLSTVYFPGDKITMLPEEAIRAFTLREGCECPALSLYVEITPDFDIVSTTSRIESVRIAANLRHDTLDPVFSAQAAADGTIDHPYAQALQLLWAFSARLEQMRRGDVAEVEQRPEYSFSIKDDRVTIARRSRGSPIDKVVSELMIYVNSEWGRQLAASETAAIYRVQGNGKVRMSAHPSAHEGLGVEQYAWSSSPLRRYVDLVNQRQLIALIRGESPPYQPNSEELLAVIRDFEAAYEIYGEFQRAMERYWCLRWLLQEQVHTVTASVLRENLVRFDPIPLVVRVPSLPALAPGSRVELAVSDIDLLDLVFHCEFHKLEGGEMETDGSAGQNP